MKDFVGPILLGFLLASLAALAGVGLATAVSPRQPRLNVRFLDAEAGVKLDTLQACILDSPTEMRCMNASHFRSEPARPQGDL